MAKNWTIKEAMEAISASNKEAIVDLGRRFPLTSVAIAKIGDNEGAQIIIGALPDHITARKIESILKDGVQESDEDEEEVMPKPEEKKEKKAPAKKDTAKKAEEEDADEEVDYSEMTAPELFKLCKSRKIKVEPKQKAATYIKALKAADAKEAKAAEEADDDWEEEEEKPAKKETKKAPTKKAAKEEDDDDEEWDI